MSSVLKSDRVEIVNTTTRAVHHDGTNMGFLTTSAGWDMYANNSGQVWAANYGWLHDYFFSAVTNCAPTTSTTGQNIPNCVDNCTNYGDSSSQVFSTQLVDNGSSIRLRTVRHYVNCNCNCNCGDCANA